MRNFLFLVAALLCLSAITAQAADASGTWLAQIPGRDGNLMDTTFQFKVSGDQLTGTMENQYGERSISDGKVSGDDVSFTVRIDINGNEMTLLFAGKVSGDQIQFTRERKGEDLVPAKVEFVAKRKK